MLEKKLDFLDWLSQNVQFEKREVYWIINYLKTHTSILKKVVIVEYAAKTPRGLVITNDVTKESMTLHLSKHQFTDADQIFHEIRINWKEVLYLELDLPDCWKVSQYLAVLEDNPFCSWNELLDSDCLSKMDEELTKLTEIFTKKGLLEAIDQALEVNDQVEFLKLTAQLKQLG